MALNKMHTKPRLSVVVPTLNEAQNIASLVRRLDTTLRPHTASYEIIFVDDNSADGTADAAQKMAADFPLRVLRKKGARGKSFSLLQGFAAAQYDLVAMIDADLQYPPEALPEMLQKMTNAQADIVIGTRSAYGTGKLRALGSKAIRTLYRVLFGLQYDIQSGLKLLKRPKLEQLDLSKTGAWTLDFELLHQATQRDWHIESVNITFAGRTHGESKVKLVSTTFEIIGHAIKIKLRARSTTKKHNTTTNKHNK